MKFKSEHGEANLKELMSSFDKFVSEEAGEGHDPNNLQEMRETFQRFLNEELAEKSFAAKSKGSKLIDTVSKVWTNILKSIEIEKSQPTSSQVHFPSTGEEDKVVKDKLNTQGRKQVKQHNFAIPSERKYPIHDLKHARNALARVAQNGSDEEKKVVRAAVEAKYPTMKSSYASHADLDPDIDNLESGILKVAIGDGENNPNDDENEDLNSDGVPDSIMSDQQLVEGMDWEIEMNNLDQDTAMTVAGEMLSDDPWYYRKKWAEQNGTDDVLEKSDGDSDDNGLHIDLGSGPVRESGHLGFDTYPYDHGTVVHDLNLGIPLPDECVSRVQMANSLHTMDGLSDDPKPLLSEIQRVLMPGGKFIYEGPNDIFNYQALKDDDLKGLVMTDHDDNDVQKDGTGQIYRQTFTRTAKPDPATMNDAEPRTGVPVYDELGSDMLLAMDALNYDWADASTSGKGNRLYGYPSQGSLLQKKWVRTSKGGPGSGPQPGQGHGGKGNPAKDKAHNERAMQMHANQTAHDAARAKEHGERAQAAAHGEGKGHGFGLGEAIAAATEHLASAAEKKSKYGNRITLQKSGSLSRSVKIAKTDTHKQIVYGVITAPNEIDSQEDWMKPEDIEEAAHKYLIDSRVIGGEHMQPLKAVPVESYIAPQDLQFDGQNGPQTVTKGSWVMGVKILDPAEWQKVLDGTYTGFSVGGYGLRDPSNPLQD